MLLTKETLESATIGEIVAQDYRTAGVFRKYGLDFCCGGGRPITEACSKKEIEPQLLFDELDALLSTESAGEDFNNWPLDQLVDHIVDQHHAFVRAKLPEISFYTTKVAKVHGSRHPELIEVYHLFAQLEAELSSHLEKEERILFPFIKRMVELKNSNSNLDVLPSFKTAANPVAMMEEEHETAGDIMAQIEELTNSFTPPEDACATYQVLFHNLRDFQEDLHQHVHLENNILFPKALKLEQQVSK